MAVIFSKDMPAYAFLQGEGADVIAKEDGNDAGEIEVAILNLMPTKQATETQLLRLVANSKYPVRITFLTTATYKPTHTPQEYMDKFYKTFDAVKDKHFDGLIVTGAPVEHMAFEDVAYWDELVKIMDYAKENVKSTLYVCWGAQAALYHFYGVQKQKLSKKLFGIFNVQKVVDDKLFDGLETLNIPNSRHTTIDDVCTRAHVQVLAQVDEVGIAIAKSDDNRSFFFTGHSEYDRYTLRTEYLRDIAKGLPIEKPVNYFADEKAIDSAVQQAFGSQDKVGAICEMASNALNDVPMTWQETARRLFANWLDNYVAN